MKVFNKPWAFSSALESSPGLYVPPSIPPKEWLDARKKFGSFVHEKIAESFKEMDSKNDDQKDTERALNAEIERLLTEKAEALEDVSDTRIDRDEARERADRLEAKCAALETENKRAFAMVETHRKERDMARSQHGSVCGLLREAQGRAERAEKGAEALRKERDEARAEIVVLRKTLQWRDIDMRELQRERDRARDAASFNFGSVRDSQFVAAMAERDTARAFASAARKEADMLRGQLRTVVQLVYDVAYNGRRFRSAGLDSAFDANARRMNVTMHVSDSGAWVGEPEVTLAIRDANQVTQKVSP